MLYMQFVFQLNHISEDYHFLQIQTMYFKILNFVLRGQVEALQNKISHKIHVEFKSLQHLNFDSKTLEPDQICLKNKNGDYLSLSLRLFH
jgi:hypothetical protein